MKRYAEYKDSGIKWIGEIPREWSLVPIKRILSAIQDGTHATFARVADGMPLLSAKNVSDDGVEISESESLISESDFNAIVSNGFPMCGDVLLCCVGTIGRCCIYTFETQMAFQRSVSFLRVNGKMTNRFLLYSLKSIALIRQMIAFANSSAQSGIYMGIVKSLMLSLPPVLIQQQIVTHLDQKTATIDELIADKQKLVALLQEKRSSIISEAVTKGLDKTVKMKDSGIEWIGEIPREWEIKKLSFCAEVQTGPFGSQLHSEDYVEQGTPIITVEHFGDGEILHQNLPLVSQSDTERLKKYSLNINDLVFSRVGSVDRCVIVKQEESGWLFSGRCLRVRFKENANVLAEYINIFFSMKSFKEYMLLVAVGATMPSINTTILNNIPVIVPTIKNQVDIVSCLNNRVPKLNGVISDINEQIEKLKEYRQAIISEAVTGKVAV